MVLNGLYFAAFQALCCIWEDGFKCFVKLRRTVFRSYIYEFKLHT